MAAKERRMVRTVLAEVTAAVRRDLPVHVDGWAPTVQGAVGRVVGVRGEDGSEYVLKIYPAQARAQAATELLALDLLRHDAALPTPRVLLRGRIDQPEPVTFLLLSRLPGARWADRRSGMPAAWNAALLADVGRLLRRLHQLSGERFGSLLPNGPSWATAWQWVDALCDDLVRQDLEADGPAALGVRVRRLVDRCRPAFGSCTSPVLCHNDFNGGNIRLETSGVPTISGVVDLERASWGDALYDLAKTRVHVAHHDPTGVDVLTRAYGVAGEYEQRRIEVYEVLHALAERTWITLDRPQRWVRSVAALEAYVGQRT